MTIRSTKFLAGNSRLRADLALLSVSLIWGSAFVVQRIVAPNNSVFLFNGLRFLVGALVLLPWLRRTSQKNPVRTSTIKEVLLPIGLAGLLLTAGSAFQQAGLRYTTAGNAGFITGLYVVFIPIIQVFFLRRASCPAIWAAAMLSAAGLFLLSTGGRFRVNFGDALVLVGAIFWALHVIWIGRLANRQDLFQIAVGQYLVCGVVSVGLGVAFERAWLANISTAAWAILYTGVLSVGLGYTLQIYGQKSSPPSDAAILLSAEAVFAALFGWVFLNERLTSLQILGCIVILAGMLLAQIRFPTGRKILLFILFAWVLPGLACNYPGYLSTSTHLSSQQLRQTLAANEATPDQAGLPVTPAGASPPVATAPFLQSGNLPTANVPPTNPVPGAQPGTGSGIYNYYARSGDTLAAIARRFKVDPQQILSPESLPVEGYLTPNQALFIPINMAAMQETAAIFPDSEVIYSPSAADFNIQEFVDQAGGYLSRYYEAIGEQRLSGAEIIQRVALLNSINPRLLLGILEFRSGWVFGEPRDPQDLDHPIGFFVPGRTGLYNEMSITASHLGIGYYGWRTGELTALKYADGSSLPVNPWLNPGSVAVQNLFAKLYKPKYWQNALYGPDNFLSSYGKALGDPWQRAAQVEPLLYPGIAQPEMELPFSPGERWSLTGGPHPSWNAGSPRGALDFAPVTGEPACSVSVMWVTAPAGGVITRSENNLVALDLDGDRNEATGWVLIFFHIADQDHISAGQVVKTNDRIGHPSCEGGNASGSHVHIARKYNGEWLEAGGPLPFVLSGWRATTGPLNYQGELVKGNQQVFASPVGPRTSIIVR
jgi:LasA protease